MLSISCVLGLPCGHCPHLYGPGEGPFVELSDLTKVAELVGRGTGFLPLSPWCKAWTLSLESNRMIATVHGAPPALWV